MVRIFFLLEDSLPSADNLGMIKLFPVLKAVFSNKDVIIAVVACMVLFEFIDYISHYRKKPPKQKSKKIVVQPTPQPAAADATEAGNDAAGE